MENIRKAVVAGQFYNGIKSGLEQQIQACFIDERGPGVLPEIKLNEPPVTGIVVPHAGYMYSGAIAAHAYSYLAHHGFAETFVILGPNHTGVGSDVSVMTEGKWETPLGEVTINHSLANRIRMGIINEDDRAHKYEHSIEVQLPFLQFAAHTNQFDFVPICIAMQNFETSKEVGEMIANAIKQYEKRVVIIASSDFSHIGFNYMSMPPAGSGVDEYTKKQDELALNQILQINPKGLIMAIQKNNISMCGYGPVAAMLIAAKRLEAKNAELLKYGTSYEVQPGNSCVGYGAVAVF